MATIGIVSRATEQCADLKARLDKLGHKVEDLGGNPESIPPHLDCVVCRVGSSAPKAYPLCVKVKNAGKINVIFMDDPGKAVDRVRAQFGQVAPAKVVAPHPPKPAAPKFVPGPRPAPFKAAPEPPPLPPFKEAPKPPPLAPKPPEAPQPESKPFGPPPPPPPFVPRDEMARVREVVLSLVAEMEKLGVSEFHVVGRHVEFTRKVVTKGTIELE